MNSQISTLRSGKHSSALLLATGLSMALTSGSVGAGDFAAQFGNLSDLGQHIISGGPPRDGIPAMNNPEFVDPDEVSYVLPNDLVLGVYRNGVAKAYPENLGWWHEIINDKIGDEGITVTLCPLTGTGLVFNATNSDGTQFELGVSGLLANSNLIMYDRRDNETLYPQMIYTAINGDQKNQSLELLPVVETTWEMWQKMYPDTRVARESTGLDRYPSSQQQNYTFDRYLRYPYGDYRENNRNLFLFVVTTADPDLLSYGAKDIVVGLCFDEMAKSYPYRILPEYAVINDLVGDTFVVLVHDEASRTAIPYSPLVDGERLKFYSVESDDGMPQFMDTLTRSRWSFLGAAVEGPLEGTQLEQLPGFNSMWFAWDTFYRGAEVWTGGGIIGEPVITAVQEEDAGLPSSFTLGQNFPNPFNPSTIIQFTLPQQGVARLMIYNAAGQHIRSLMQGEQTAGVYMLNWDGRDASGAEVASGSYLYRLEMPHAGISQTRMMTLAR